MKKLFSWLFLFFLACAFFSSFATCSEKSAEQWLSETDVCFEAKKLSDGICVIGKEAGEEVFRTNVNVTGTNFTGFTFHSSGNFHLELLNDLLYFQHTFSNGEMFEIGIDFTGNFSILQSSQVHSLNSGFQRAVSWGFDTFGSFIVDNTFVASSIVVRANRIVNKGSFQTGTCQLFQNQMINDGVFIVGEKPVAPTNLKSRFESYSGTDSPKFVYGQVLNRGSWISTGDFNFKGGLQFDNECFSSFGNVQIHNNGGLKTRNPVIISGKLSGHVSTLEIEEGGFIKADEIDIGEVRDLKVAQKSCIHSTKDLSLKITGTYVNHGQILSENNLKLEVIKPITSQQKGFVVAGENLEANPVRLRGDEEFERYLLDHPNSTTESDSTCRRLWEALMIRNGLPKNAQIYGLGQPVAKKCIKIRVIDHYLNRIHEHYHNGILVSRTETGYVYQNTTTERVEGTLPTAQLNLSRFLTQLVPSRRQLVLDAIAAIKKDLSAAQSSDGAVLNDIQTFGSQISKYFMLAGATSQEIFRLSRGSGLFGCMYTLGNWHTLIDKKRWAEMPLYADLYEFAEDLQDPALHDPGSDWHRRFCQRPVSRTTTTIGNPFKVFTDIHPLMMAMPIAILCDAVGDGTVDVLGKYITQILGRDAPILDYMLKFMSSGLDPPLDRILFDKEHDDTKESTQEQSDEASGKVDETPPDPEEPKFHDHHIIPKEVKEFVERVGIDIDDFTFTLEETEHLKGIHGKGYNGLKGRWNKMWKFFRWLYPNATREEIIGFARRMMKRFNIPEESLHVYKKPKIRTKLK